MLGPPSLTSTEWERYLVYAVALGMHRKVVPTLGRLAPEGHHRPIWYTPRTHDIAASDLGQLGRRMARRMTSPAAS